MRKAAPKLLLHGVMFAIVMGVAAALLLWSTGFVEQWDAFAWFGAAVALFGTAIGIRWMRRRPFYARYALSVCVVLFLVASVMADFRLEPVDDYVTPNLSAAELHFRTFGRWFARVSVIAQLILGAAVGYDLNREVGFDGSQRRTLDLRSSWPILTFFGLNLLYSAGVTLLTSGWLEGERRDGFYFAVPAVALCVLGIVSWVRHWRVVQPLLFVMLAGCGFATLVAFDVLEQSVGPWLLIAACAELASLTAVILLPLRYDVSAWFEPASSPSESEAV